MNYCGLRPLNERCSLLLTLGLLSWTLAGCGPALPGKLLAIDLHSKDTAPILPAQLEEGNGILIAEIETNSPIHRLAIESVERSGRRFYLQTLPAKRQYQVLQLPRGRYRWGKIEILESVQGMRVRPIRWDSSDDREDLEFDVHAGKVNYPGILVLSRKNFWLTSFTLNRSGELAQKLLNGPKWLLREYPVVSSGRRRDDFLEYYSSRIAAKSITEPVAAASATPAPLEDSVDEIQ